VQRRSGTPQGSCLARTRHTRLREGRSSPLIRCGSRVPRERGQALGIGNTVPYGLDKRGVFKVEAEAARRARRLMASLWRSEFLRRVNRYRVVRVQTFELPLRHCMLRAKSLLRTPGSV
jgi:hypothetical protein